MKKIIDGIWAFLEAMGTARAATALTRAGKIELAKDLYRKS